MFILSNVDLTKRFAKQVSENFVIFRSAVAVFFVGITGDGSILIPSGILFLLVRTRKEFGKNSV